MNMYIYIYIYTYIHTYIYIYIYIYIQQVDALEVEFAERSQPLRRERVSKYRVSMHACNH